MASLGTADDLSCAGRCGPSHITPPSGIWHMLCSDQTWLSHNSAIPKQQIRRAFSSLGFKQVCDVLVEELSRPCASFPSPLRPDASAVAADTNY